MPALRLLLATFLLAAVAAHAGTTPKATLKPFASEAELQALLKAWGEQLERRRSARAEAYGMPSAPASASVTAKAAEAAADSVTNVQHAGVDEGGIVKLHGEHLVILRRGRLFTVE